MKNVFVLLIFILLISVEIQAQDNLNDVMYVNAPAGLRVRNSPNVNGEIIGVLEYFSMVRVTQEDFNNIIIDGIEGKWIYVLTAEIEGWVFNGYLARKFSTMEDTIRFFQRYYNLSSGNTFLYDGTVRLAPTIAYFLTNLNIRNYSIIGSRSYNTEGGIVNEYRIEFGQNTIIITDADDDTYYTWVNMLEINLSEEILNLFPYETMIKFRESEIFFQSEHIGTYTIFGTDSIRYSVGDEVDWVLQFNEGRLNKISLYLSRQ